MQIQQNANKIFFFGLCSKKNQISQQKKMHANTTKRK